MTDDTDLIERIDDVGEFLRRNGRYHTTSAHQAYAVLKALDWHPWVKLGEELYFPEGSVLFAKIDPVKSMTPNVKKVGWGTTEDYYEHRLLEYSNWEVAFWREIIQNSRDSGATRIDLECVEDVYEDPETKERVDAMRVSASDNGKGMDYNTLMTAFFRRGGTLKEEGSVGGFGDAKNLILTPWLGYEVRSRGVMVRGRHEDLFEDMTRQDLPHQEGTKVTVWMPLTKTTTPQHAQFLIEQSSLDGIRFTINGTSAKGSLPKGKEVKELDIRVNGAVVGKLIVYHSPRARRRGVYVRSHGLYMYEATGFKGDYKGVVTIEVNAPPVHVFSTKRNALSYDSTARADVESLMQELSVDPRTALKSKRDLKQQVFPGAGAIELEGRVAEMAAEIAARAGIERQKRMKNGTIKLDKNAVLVLKEEFTKKAEELDDGLNPGDGSVFLTPLPSTFGTLVAQTEFVNTEQVAGAIKMSMWKPDFFIFQSISPWRMPKALHPETMSNKYHVLLTVWTEVCKFLLVQFGMFEPFGVGWAFDSDGFSGSVTAAAYSNYDNRHWLLINPVDIEQYGSGYDKSFEMSGDRFQTSNPSDMESLVALAVHEITHMQGFTRSGREYDLKSHGESYVAAFTANMEVVFRIAPVLKKIIKEARSVVREVRKEAKKDATKVTWSGSHGNWVGKYRRRHVAEIHQWGLNADEYRITVYDRDGNPGSIPKEMSLHGAKEAVDVAVLAQYPSANRNYDWADHIDAGRIFAIRKSDDLAVGYLEDRGGHYEIYVAREPGDPTDTIYDSKYKGYKRTKTDAKANLIEAIEEKFGPALAPPKKVTVSPGVRIAWDEEQSGDYLYGYDPVSQATRASVHVVPLPGGVGLDFYPRAWNDDSGRWEEGRPGIDMASAKKTAEKMYAKLAAAS